VPHVAGLPQGVVVQPQLGVIIRHRSLLPRRIQ
jgi:hypothetical protein